MNKKKISTLLIVGMLTIGVISGTLAYFTSTDSVTNKFSTGTTDDSSNPDAGIKIEENFLDSSNGEYKKPVLPGMTMTKEVKVKNTANYDQYVRAKIEKVWKNNNGEKVTHYKVENGNITYLGENDDKSGATELSLDKIKLNLSEAGTSKGNSWTSEIGGYYYYNQKLAPQGQTALLLESVTFLSDDTDNYYKNLKFDVIVTAESIQTEGITASNKPSEWSNLHSYVFE